MFAKEFAKGLLCLSKNEKPCNKCKSCLEIENYNNPDFLVIECEEDEDSIKIAQIRDMTKKVLEKPIVSNRKIYIINDSEKMTKEAQNSLLKTLEEPPEYICIILVTSNDNLFLNTIKSRCVKIKFNKLTNEEVEKVLKEKLEYKDFPKSLFKIADGSVKRTIDIQDKEATYSKIEKLFSNLENTNKLEAINSKEQIFENKEEVNDILEYINIILFGLIEKKKDNKYIECMEIVEETKGRLKRNSNYDMTLDRMLITIWEKLNGGK